MPGMLQQDSVLVLGTGELGFEVLQCLSAHHECRARTITVLLRPCRADKEAISKREAQISDFKRLSISVIEGDIVNDSETKLKDLFAPFHTVVGCSGMYFPPGTQLKISRAVLAARVKRYVPWQYGLDYDAIGRGSSQDLFSEQLDVRDLLRSQSTTQWVIVSTGLFMTFLFEPSFGVVDADKSTVTALGSWENGVTATAPHDIGRVVAELVWAVEDVTGVVYTAGASVSYAELAQKIEDYQGVAVRRKLAEIDQLKRELDAEPNNGLRKYRVVFSEGKGVRWEMEKTFNKQRGLSMTSVEEWLKSNGRNV